MLKALVESKIIESSECDQFRDGAWIVITGTDLPTCPVKALESYISLFRALATPRSRERVRSQGISSTRTRELIEVAFRDITDVSRLN